MTSFCWSEDVKKYDNDAFLSFGCYVLGLARISLAGMGRFAVWELFRQPDVVGTALSFTAVLFNLFFSNPLFSAVAQRTPIKSLCKVRS